MTTEQAEQWQAWATTYVNMELEAYPNASHATQLREAQARANECIDQDHMLVLQNVSQSSPRYYYPGLRAPQTMHMHHTIRVWQSEMDKTKADLLTDAVNDDATMQHAPIDITDGNEDQISLGSELEDIELMGPS
jgi:hypothetical protein